MAAGGWSVKVVLTPQAVKAGFTELASIAAGRAGGRTEGYRLQAMSAGSELDRERLAALGVDDALIAKRERLDGARALRFLAELPALVTRWEDRLGLSGARVMPGGVLSAALACTRRRDGAPVVLKLSAPDAFSAGAEAAALAAWEGVGACALLHADEDGRVLLLAAILPGGPVRPTVDDDADARRAAALIADLHRVPAQRAPDAIPDAAGELRWRFERAHAQLDGGSYAGGLITHEELDSAYREAVSLHAQAPAKVMCHGDFMNKNILLDADGRWWAIDPRPCVADRCLDAAFWALTHRPGDGVPQRCASIAREAGLDPARVWAWATAFAASEAVLVTDVERARAHSAVLHSGRAQ